MELYSESTGFFDPWPTPIHKPICASSFSTKFRRNLIEKSWDDLNAYVAGIIRNHGQRVVIVTVCRITSTSSASNAPTWLRQR